MKSASGRMHYLVVHGCRTWIVAFGGVMHWSSGEDRDTCTMAGQNTEERDGGHCRARAIERSIIESRSESERRLQKGGGR